MPDLIDADSHDELTGGDPAIAYNIPDLKALAAKILRRANDVANQKIQQAQQQIKQAEEEARVAGEKKGYEQGLQKGEADGRAAGEKAAREEFAGKVGPVLGAMQSLLQNLAARKTELQAKAEADMLRLGMEVAKRIVRREIELDDEFIVPILREALALTNNRSDLIVRMHPDDEKAVSEELPNLHAIFSDLGRVQLEPDTTVDRGGVVVQTRQSEVDMKLWRQFEALERALVGDTEGLDFRAEDAPEVSVLAADGVEDSQDSTAGSAAEYDEATYEDVQKVLEQNGLQDAAQNQMPQPQKAAAPDQKTQPSAPAAVKDNPAQPAKPAQPEVETADIPDAAAKNPPQPQKNQPAAQTQKPDEPAASQTPPDEFAPMDAEAVPQGANLVADNKTIEDVTGDAPSAPKPAAGKSAPAAAGADKKADVTADSSASSLHGVVSMQHLPKNPATEKLIEQSVRAHIGNAKR